MLLRKEFGNLLNPNAETFVEMFAEDGILEFPYALPNTAQLRGREAIRQHLEAHARSIIFLDVSDAERHNTNDRELFMLRFMGYGRGVKNGETFKQNYVSVIRIRDGYIVHYLDYWNPVEIVRTLKGDAVVASLSEID